MKRAKPLTKTLTEQIVDVMIAYDHETLGIKSAKVQYRRGIINELHALVLLHGVCITNTKLTYELTVDQFRKCVSQYLNN